MSRLRGERGSRPWAVLCDFDDTAAAENVAQLVVRRFAPGTGQEIAQAYREGRTTFREYQEASFQRVQAPLAELQAYVKAQGTLRPGFLELVAYCRKKGVPLLIVTVGLDFYVAALLDKYGLGDLPRVAVQTHQVDGRWEFTYCYQREGCGGWGLCKCHSLEEYQRQGHRVLYIGDGISDVCPAEKADLVFALRQLPQLCLARGIPYLDLMDFRQVINFLEAARQDQGGGGL